MLLVNVTITVVSIFDLIPFSGGLGQELFFLKMLNKPSMSNVVYATKIYNNEEILEIKAFRRRYQEVEGYDEKRHTITLWPLRRKEITPEMFFIGAVKKMIHREYGWSFLTCKQCGRSAKESDDESSSRKASKFKSKAKTYACKIHKGMTSVVPKYKVIICVIDDTGSASLLLYKDMIM
ncbi:hypothetical protein Tco_0078510 [Tanacetum coccineum]